jgi:hypothetical protein
MYNIGPKLQNGRWTIQMDYKATAACLKSTAIITALATAVLGSALLAYQNPSHWCLTTFSVSIVNVYLLPKILHYGNCRMIKIALIINLTTLGSLSLGGIGVSIISLGKDVITSLKIYELSSALFSTYLITGFIGYGIPVFQEVLKKAYQMLNIGDEWGDRFLQIQNKFHNIPELGLGFLQTNLVNNFLLQLCLLVPNIMSSDLLHRLIPDYMRSMLDFFETNMRIEEFEMEISRMEEMVASQKKNLQPSESNSVVVEPLLTEDMKRSWLLSLKIGLRRINKEDLPKAISLLLSTAPRLIPNSDLTVGALSNREFLEFFEEQKDAQDVTNSLIEQFVESIDLWKNDLKKRYDNLCVEVCLLDQKVVVCESEFSEQQKTEFSKKLQTLNEEFKALRTTIEKIYKNKRIWRNFHLIWQKNENLPFTNKDQFLNILHDQDLFKNIDQAYHSMFENHSRKDNPNIAFRLQYIKNKLGGTEEEAKTPFMFLCTNRDFREKDVETLQESLKLASPYDIEATMASIGLVTEDDLYTKNILPRNSQINKQTILDNLVVYIKNNPPKAPTAIIQFLTDKGFTTADFRKLQDQLGLNSCDKIKETMESIGLGTDHLLYLQNILPCNDQIEKQAILDNLINYIKKNVREAPSLADRIQPQNEVNWATPAYRVIEKVTRVVYHAITSGLILAPVFINPVVGSTSIVLGIGFFILKRFDFPGTQAFSNFSGEILNNLPFGQRMRSLLNRRIFSIDHRTQAANEFINANFLSRMRILNIQIFHALFVTYSTISTVRFEQPLMGSFMQGVAIANEFTTELFNRLRHT